MIAIRKNVMTLFCLTLLLASGTSDIYSQEKTKDQKIRRVTVTEEKHDGREVTTNIESETSYDINGNIIEQILYKGGEVDTHFRYEYDSNNNKIKEIEYTKKGAVDKISEYKIQNGKRVEKTVYDDRKNLLLKKSYQYLYY
jgi:hypothetical protein